MKKVLVLAALSEVATGVALLMVPSLVGQWLFGTALTGIAVTVARVTGIVLTALGVACWPGTPLVGMLTYNAVSRLRRRRGRLERPPPVAGGRPARGPDNPVDPGINTRPGDERIEA